MGDFEGTLRTARIREIALDVARTLRANTLQWMGDGRRSVPTPLHVTTSHDLRARHLPSTTHN